LVSSVAFSASVRAIRMVGYAHHIGGEARSDELLDELARGHEHLAAQVSALFGGGELVFVVDARRARLDERFGEFEGVQHAAEARLAIGDNRRVPVDVVASLRVLFLILTAEGVVDALHDGGHAVDRVQAQVGVGLHCDRFASAATCQPLR
jgi:hypothetical protein